MNNGQDNNSIRLLDALPVHSHHTAFKAPESTAELARRGIQVVQDGEYDIAIVSARWLDDAVWTSGKPCLLYAHADSADLGGYRNLFSAPQCVAVLQITSFIDPALHSEPAYHRRWFVGKLFVASARAKRPPPIPDGVLDKIVLSWELAQMDYMRAFYKVGLAALDDSRPTLVFFRGTTKYKLKPITEHRQSCAREIQRLYPHDSDIATRVCVSGTEYLDRQRRCNVVVAPWGNGESCRREYQGLMMGNAVVMPRCEWVATRSGIYQSDHITWCKPDWSDLQEAVERAASKSREARERSQKWARGLFRYRHIVAADAIEEAVAKAAKTRRAP